MNYKDVERLALSLPGATMKMEFGPAPVFRVGGKLFLVITLDEGARPDGLWFKVEPTSFHILTRLRGVTPCTSMARAGWIALDGLQRLNPAELKARIMKSYELVAAKLPKRTRAALGIAP